MDRRFLLAVGLMILVLVLNSFLFGKKTAPPPTTPADTTSVAPETAAPAPAPPAGADSGLAGASALRRGAEGAPGVPSPSGVLRNVSAPAAGTAETVQIATTYVDAEFDPLGGSLRSWRLHSYTGPQGEPADLVRHGRDLGALWFALHIGGRVVRTDSTLFQTSVSDENGAKVIRFTAEDASGLRIEKTFSVPRDRYDCGLAVKVSGVPEGQEAYWEIGWVDGLPLLEKDTRSEAAAISSVALFGKEYIRTHAGGGFGCARGTGGEKNEVHEGTLRWLGVRNRYFLGALILDSPSERRVLTGYDGEARSASALLLEPLSLEGPTERDYRLYLGPIHYSILDSYGVGLERVQDLGPGVLRPFSKLLMKFFEGLNKIVPNYGFEIVILSVLLRFLFYPLTKKSMHSMKQMQMLKPELDRINEKFKNDPKRKQEETLELYRKNKINPLGGCLPVLIQLPVLSGLYYVLANAIQLRKEPFVLWIRDLAAPDTVAHLAGFPVNVMPLIMAATMVWQQKITPSDPRQASLGYIMPIFFTFLFYSTPSGLVLYWTVNNLMTVLQQIWMNRSAPAVALVGAEEEPRRGQGRGKRR
ncbi:MAG: membrane protein insertase YidC [Candidatus Eisenbacteria bacterium]|nr:membrane protein insertase YidC [Candidatus Eisenbacteria bacterium]